MIIFSRPYLPAAMAAVNLNVFLILSVGLLCFGASSVSARLINITYLNNCQDLGDEKPTVYVTDVDYHISETDGLCDMVHTTLHITTLDPEPLELDMTLYKCEESNMKEPCVANPTVHGELLDCERLKNDDSGPWHMFTSVMDDEYKCGNKLGELKLEFARLKLEHLIKYLDVYDANFNTFRLKMYFKSTATNALRGCGEIDFTLLPM